MREENTDIVLKNLLLPEEGQAPMTEWQKKLYSQVKTCLDIMADKLLVPTPDLRDKLMEDMGCSRSQAYVVILLARRVAGNKEPTAKRAVREDMLEAARMAYQDALGIEDKKDRVKAITDIINSMARCFNLGEDEGEALDIARYLTEETVEFTTDEKVIGVEWTEKDEARARAMKRKYHIEDADYMDVSDETGDGPSTGSGAEEEGEEASDEGDEKGLHA